MHKTEGLIRSPTTLANCEKYKFLIHYMIETASCHTKQKNILDRFTLSMTVIFQHCNLKHER